MNGQKKIMVSIPAKPKNRQADETLVTVDPDMITDVIDYVGDNNVSWKRCAMASGSVFHIRVTVYAKMMLAADVKHFTAKDLGVEVSTS